MAPGTSACEIKTTSSLCQAQPASIQPAQGNIEFGFGFADLPYGLSQRCLCELFYPRDWKAITIEQFVAEVDAYIRWYNEKRIKISLGSLSPVE